MGVDINLQTVYWPLSSSDSASLRGLHIDYTQATFFFFALFRKVSASPRCDWPCTVFISAYFNEAEFPSSYLCQSTPHASISPPAFPINRHLRTHLKEELVAALCNNNHHHQKGTSVSALQPSIKCSTVGMGGWVWVGVDGWRGHFMWIPYPVEARCHSSAFPLKKPKKNQPLEWSTQRTEWRENLSCFVVSLAFDQRLYSCCIYAAPFSVSDPCTPPRGPAGAAMTRTPGWKTHLCI